ncbi:MAG: hypothetical protein V1744_04965 [Candidatus Altiarchaeota archaeon]
MKGYLFTALTVLMFMSLFMVSYYFYVKSSATVRLDIGAEKTAALFDDVSCDLAAKLDLKAAVDNSDKTLYSFNDRIPAGWDIPSAVRNYSTFLSSTYAEQTNLKLTPDLTALSSPSDEVDLEVMPFHYYYGYSNLSKEKTWFRNKAITNPPPSDPEAYDMTLDFNGEGVEDLVWEEGEDFSGGSITTTPHSEASEGEYAESFDGAITRSVYIPFDTNYTLWVRTVFDNSTKNLTVEVDGKNSTQFNIRNDSSSSLAFKWFNDTAVIFNLTEGNKLIRVYPGPASTTDSLDVVLLTTRYYDLDNTAPITRPVDQAEVNFTGGVDLRLSLTVRFNNVNHTLESENIDSNALSEWNFTFNDGDSVRINFGAVDVSEVPSYSMAVLINDTVNGSFGLANTTVTFEASGGRAYVDSGCTLSQAGTLSRSDRIWLAKG